MEQDNYMEEDEVVEYETVETEEDYQDYSTETQERNVWNSQSVHLLIKEFKKHRALFVNPEIKRRNIWSKIANRLQAHGYVFDTDQCEKKWRNLKTYYTMNKGKDIVTWPFYKAMRDALSDEKSVKKKEPETNGKNVPLKAEPEAAEENESDEEENIDDDSAPPAWFANFLTQFREDEMQKMKMLEEMHEDIIKLEKQKCSLLQSLIEKLT